MVKRKDVIKYFKAFGFKLEGGTNHDKLVHPDGRRTVLGRHTEIRNARFEQMKKQAGLKWSVYISPKKGRSKDESDERE